MKGTGLPQYTCWRSTFSFPNGRFHVNAPPSAVVKFFTAWKENEEKSAISPAILP